MNATTQLPREVRSDRRISIPDWARHLPIGELYPWQRGR